MLVQFSRSVMSDSLWPHELQHARPPSPSPTPGVHSNSCPLSRWSHPAISSSVVPFSSCPQSLPASGSFPMSQLFSWGGQSIGVSASASILPTNTHYWSPLGWTGWISLQSKGLIKYDNFVGCKVVTDKAIIIPSLRESKQGRNLGSWNGVKPMHGGAWWATVHGVAKSQTGPNDFTFTFKTPKLIIRPLEDEWLF